MVNNLRKHRWEPPPALPLPEGHLERRIDGPRYNLDEVKKLVASDDSMRFVTDRVEEDLIALAWDADDVASLIRELTPDDYHASEWAQLSHRLVIDADAYVIRYDHNELTRNQFMPSYYVKFGFANNNILLLLVSCHLERSRL